MKRGLNEFRCARPQMKSLIGFKLNGQEPNSGSKEIRRTRKMDIGTVPLPYVDGTS